MMLRGKARRQGAAARVLLLGVGNPLRGDDGIGPRLARLVTGAVPQGVVVRCRHGDLLDLVDECAGYDALVCVDAAAPAGSPGRTHRFNLAVRALPSMLLPTSSHGLGLVDALELARALGTLPSRVVVYAIEAQAFDQGADIDPAVAAGARRAARRLLGELRRLAWLASRPASRSRRGRDGSAGRREDP